jgi:hypothetical protein
MGNEADTVLPIKAKLEYDKDELIFNFLLIKSNAKALA